MIETRREDDFAPVKNVEGLDSPVTCREAQVAQFGRWLAAGLKADAQRQSQKKERPKAPRRKR